MTATGSASSRRSLDGGAVVVATSVMNVATYGFTIIAARVIGPSEYGAFVACLGLLLVAQVVAYGLQATAARRIVVDATNVAAIERAILALGLRVALGLGLVLGALVPVITSLLRLDSPATAVVLALAAVPLTIAGGQAGILQGERRWGALAIFYLAAGVPRLLVGTGLVLWRPDATTAFVGVALGLLFPLGVGFWALRHRRGTSQVVPEHSSSAMLVETAHNSQVLLAFFALSSIDIVLARQVLTGHEAGLYAAGLIMTKVMLFLPQFVVVVAFPDMASQESRRRALVTSLAVVATIGALVVLAARVLSGVAMVFVGGSDFADVEDLLWVFALLGTLLAMLQLQVYAVLARQGRRTVLLVWGALVVVALTGYRADSFVQLVSTVAAVDAALLVVLTALSLRVARAPAAGPDA